MRTNVLTVTAGLVLMLSACGGSDADVATPAATTSAAAAATTPAAAATTEVAEVDYKADTKKVCKKVEKLLDGKEMTSFGEDLGKMIVYKQAKRTDKANEAQDDARADLQALAKAMRRDTAAAKDPEVVAAGEEGATEIDKSAGTSAFFKKIKSLKTLDSELQSEVVAWLTPLSPSCS